MSKVRIGVRDLLGLVTVFSLTIGNYVAIRGRWPPLDGFSPFDAYVGLFVAIGTFGFALSWNTRRFLGPVIYRTGRVWGVNHYLTLAGVSFLVSLLLLAFGNRYSVIVATIAFLTCLFVAVAMLIQPDAQLRERGLSVGGQYWKWKGLRYRVVHYEGEDRSVVEVVEPWYRGNSRWNRFRVSPDQYKKVVAIFDAKGAEEVPPT